LMAARWIERLLARHEPPLTVSQYLALRSIARDRVAASELARRAAVSGPAVSQLIAGLAAAGLLERQPAADRRRQDLALSADGARTLRSAEDLLRRQLGSLLGELPQPDAAALGRALPRVEAALSGEPPPRRPPRPPRPPRPGHGRPL